MRSSLCCSLFAISIFSAVPAAAQVGGPSVVVVNSATYSTDAPLAPGMLATAFGEFPGVTEAVASDPGVRTLGNAQVLVNGTAAPLLYVSSRQINFVVPMELRVRQSAEIAITVNGNVVASSGVQVADRSPLLFVQSADALRPALALMPNGALNGTNNRASAGDRVTLFVTGFGRDTDFDAAGVMIGLDQIRVERVRTDPSLPGVRLIDFIVPQRTGGAGPAPIAVHAGGSASNTVTIQVQ